MQGADLSEVLAIERVVQLMPWSRLSFEECLTRQETDAAAGSSKPKAHHCQLIEYQDEIVAYYVVCPIVDELHILTLAVSQAYQGRGLGHLLIQNIIDFAEQQKLKRVFLEVRISNSTAQNLYQKWQFRQIGLRKAYYRQAGGQREDALVLVRQLSPTKFAP